MCLKAWEKLMMLHLKSHLTPNCNPHICMPQAFAELQAKMIDTQQKAKLADLQIEQLSRMKKHANLTHGEITALPNSTRMYEGAGRMYVHFVSVKSALIENYLLSSLFWPSSHFFPGSFYSQKMRSPISFWKSRRQRMRRSRSLR